MADAVSAALLAAGKSMAATMRTVAARYTRRGAAAVNLTSGPDRVYVRAGTPGGPYGWEPINVSALENNLRHELFGNDKRWYPENLKHGMQRGLITGPTAEEGSNRAVDAFADAFVSEIFG